VPIGKHLLPDLVPFVWTFCSVLLSPILMFDVRTVSICKIRLLVSICISSRSPFETLDVQTVYVKGLVNGLAELANGFEGVQDTFVQPDPNHARAKVDEEEPHLQHLCLPLVLRETAVLAEAFEQLGKAFSGSVGQRQQGCKVGAHVLIDEP
jgi:hypothetical protein